MSFEVGSPVRVTTEDAGDYFERIAVIAKVEGAIGFWLDFQGKEPPLYFSRNEVEEVPGWEWDLLHPDKPRTTFRVGDTVKLTGGDWAAVTGLDIDSFYTVRSVNDEENGWAVIDTREGWMVDPRPGQPFSAEIVEWLDDTEKQEVEPSYYDFPQGIEVRHISAHLTSFGGQALQYVARSTRLDGRNKGNPIEDLTKALDFIQWEIDRLREIE